MSIQPSWQTPIQSFEQFCRDAYAAPEQVYLRGVRPCHPAALTLASLAEERTTFWIKGDGWTARGIRKSAGELAIERLERRSRNPRKSKRARLSNIRFIRES